jgi:protein phosphatase 1 regulatory subunit 10
VSRLVQLMQKFSKKLVSKVVYIKILRASTPQLLDKFLDERGWDLLNYWSVDFWF